MILVDNIIILAIHINTADTVHVAMYNMNFVHIFNSPIIAHHILANNYHMAELGLVVLCRDRRHFVKCIKCLFPMVGVLWHAIIWYLDYW